MNKKILLAILLMGFTSLVVQTLLIREFLISFHGNEFSIGIILANWIILEALGSGLLSRSSLKSTNPYLSYALFQTGIALYLPLAIFAIRIVKNLLGLTLGEGVGILPIFFTSLLILAPLSFLDGAQFPFGCRILSDKSGKPLESTARVYILEAAGFIIAGPVFTFILITKLNSFSIAFLLGLLNLSCAILLIKEKLTPPAKYFLILANVLFVLTALTFLGPASKLQQLSVNKQYRGQKVLKYQNSIYGNLTVLQSESQYTFYSDGIPIITIPLSDIAYIEDMVHFGMQSCSNPKNILLLSGGAGGIINELLKYPVDKITYVELDPLLIKLVKEFPTELTQQELNNPKVQIQNIDARLFLRLTCASAALAEDDYAPGACGYDVIILNLPMPSTLQLNRFYTEEFFNIACSHLNQDGVFLFSLPGSLSYLSPQMRSLNSSILNTARDMFYINIIPGNYNLFIAKKQDFKITPQILLERLDKKAISTKLFNSFYLRERMHPQWLKLFNDSLEGYSHSRKNLDLSPSGVFYSVSYWNSIFSPRMQWLFKVLDGLNLSVLLLGLAAMGVLLLIWRLICKDKKMAVGFAIGATGFAGMSLNLMFIYAYQAFFGFVFAHIAILTAAFMAGLTLGGWGITARLEKIKNGYTSFLKIELSIVLFSAMVMLLLSYLGRLVGITGIPILFFILSALCGFLVGMEFPLANKIYREDKASAESAGILYALDLGGAWLAALTVSVALVPVVGIVKTCIFLIALKVISLFLIFI